MTDAAKRLLTISITLSGGPVFFLSDASYPQGLKLAAIIIHVPLVLGVYHVCSANRKDTIEHKLTFSVQTRGSIMSYRGLTDRKRAGT
jgi:hypothetical protein